MAPLFFLDFGFNTICCFLSGVASACDTTDDWTLDGRSEAASSTLYKEDLKSGGEGFRKHGVGEYFVGG